MLLTYMHMAEIKLQCCQVSHKQHNTFNVPKRLKTSPAQDDPMTSHNHRHAHADSTEYPPPLLNPLYMYIKQPMRLHRPSQHSTTQNLVHATYRYTAQLQAALHISSL
jgi:hypothetical protein